MEWTALKRVRDYQESAAWSKYADYRAVVCDDGYPDDIAIDNDDCASYTLHHYRRASFIVWHRSDGFQELDEYPSESAALESWQDILDAIERDRQAAANEAHPDEWIIHVPYGYQYRYDARHSDREDAVAEFQSIAARLYAMEMSESKSIETTIDSDNLGDSFEVYDSESAMMSNVDVNGVYWIEHIDNSDARERYLDWI